MDISSVLASITLNLLTRSHLSTAESGSYLHEMYYEATVRIDSYNPLPNWLTASYSPLS